MKDILIRQIPILASLPAEELTRLEASLAVRKFPGSTLLFREGEKGDVFYIISAGQVQVIKSLGTADERIISVNGSGEFTGEMSLLNPDRLRTASVRTLGDVEALEVPLAEFESLLKRYPSVGYELVHVLSRRLDSSNNAAMRELHEKNRELAASHQQISGSLRKVKSQRRLIVGLLVLLLLAVSAIAGSLAYFLLSARTALDTPSDVVLLMAEAGRQFIIPGDVAASKNPVPSNPDSIAGGRRVFTARCSLCHGSDGKGQTPIGSHIYPRASDLTSTQAQTKSDGVLFWIVQNGSPHTGMPGWKGTLSDDDSWTVVSYLRLLPQGSDAIGKLLPTPSPSPTPLPSPTPPPTPTAAPTQAAPVAAASPTPRAAATSAPVQAGSTVTVTIDNYQYLPPTLNIAAGTRVVWINNDDDEHNMVSETNPRTLESPLIHKNESFSFVFAQPGTYAYFCEPHDFMHAVVVVK
jgi:CRP-like cAMP-binding protein/plastocyanin/mono/diheme cytochrome c family protein